jgi:hypothetical protein
MTPTPTPHPRLTAEEMERQATLIETTDPIGDGLITTAANGLRDGAHALRVLAALRELLRWRATQDPEGNDITTLNDIKCELDRLDGELS